MDNKLDKINFIRNLDVVRFTKDQKVYYDVDTIKNVLNLPKSKIQRTLLKVSNNYIRYKNLHLHTEDTFIEVLLFLERKKNEKKLIEKKNKVEIPNLWYYKEDKKIKFINEPTLDGKILKKLTRYLAIKHNLINTQD